VVGCGRRAGWLVHWPIRCVAKWTAVSPELFAARGGMGGMGGMGNVIL